MHSVVYKYRAFKFKEFIKTPEINVLIRMIIQKRGLEAVIQDNNTLFKDKTQYKSHIEKIIDHLMVQLE